MINKVFICGTLEKNPELVKNYCRFHLIITEEYTNRDNTKCTRTTKHPVSLCGKPAEAFALSAKAGDTILIEGKLIQNIFRDDLGQETREYRTFGLQFKIVPASLPTPEEQEANGNTGYYESF